MREKLVDFNFQVKWVPGKTHDIADALSRVPVFRHEEEVNLHQVRSEPSAGLKTLMEAAKTDDDYKRLWMSSRRTSP